MWTISAVAEVVAFERGVWAWRAIKQGMLLTLVEPV